MGKDTIYGEDGNDTIVVDDAIEYSISSGDDIDGGSGIDKIRAVSVDPSSSLLSIKLGVLTSIEVLENTSSTQELLIQGSGKIDVSSITSYVTAGGAIGQIGETPATIQSMGLTILAIKTASLGTAETI